MKKFFIIIGLIVMLGQSTKSFNEIDPLSYNNPPYTTITVTLTNTPIDNPCNECDTWYISVWEWDPVSGRHEKIGPDQAFSSTQTTYTWTNLTWDDSGYPRVYLKWHFVDGGSGCNGYSTQDHYSAYKTSTPFNWADFYPCQ